MLLKVGDNISTDDISPAGARALPFRSNIPRLAEFTFTRIDETYPQRAQQLRDTGHIIVGGLNYGQGSSREHAAIAPAHLGLRVVIATEDGLEVRNLTRDRYFIVHHHLSERQVRDVLAGGLIPHLTA